MTVTTYSFTTPGTMTAWTVPFHTAGSMTVKVVGGATLRFTALYDSGLADPLA